MPHQFVSYTPYFLYLLSIAFLSFMSFNSWMTKVCNGNNCYRKKGGKRSRLKLANNSGVVGSITCRKWLECQKVITLIIDVRNSWPEETTVSISEEHGRVSRLNSLQLCRAVNLPACWFRSKAKLRRYEAALRQLRPPDGSLLPSPGYYLQLKAMPDS